MTAEKDEKKGVKKLKGEKLIRQEKKVSNVVRVGETNLDGNKKVSAALMQIKGISFAFANAISQVSGLGEKKVSELSENEIQMLEDIINHPNKYQIPSWMFNRRKDFETGKDMHLTTSQLEFTHKMDIDREKKIRSYRGIRHSLGLPVRGQRTRSSFRKGTTVGVQRKKSAQQQSSK